MTNHQQNPQPPSSTSFRFFSWIRSLGLVRGDDAWVAGVCSAVAGRTGLDPLLVRGIAIVIAILGGPVVLAYAVGWALLPDSRGLIHAEEALNRRFTPPMITIGLIAILSLTPLWRGFWFEGVPFGWGMPGWLGTTLHTFWIIGLCVGAIWLIVVIARQVSGKRQAPSPGATSEFTAGSTPGSTPGDGMPGTGATGAGYAAAAEDRYPNDGRYDATPRQGRSDRNAARPAAGYAAWATTTVGQDASAPGTATNGNQPHSNPVHSNPTHSNPPHSNPVHGNSRHNTASGAATATSTASATATGGTTTGSTAGASFDWNEHVTQPINDAAKATREAFAPAPGRPLPLRTRSASGAYVAIVLGLALVAAAVAGAATATLTPNPWGFPAAVTALGVIAIGIVISGIRGRTSGGLSPFAIVLAVVLAFTGIFPPGTQVGIIGSRTFTVTDVSPLNNSGYVMLAGNVEVDASSITPSFSGTAEIDLWVGAGNVTVVIPDDMPVRTQASVLGGNVTFQSDSPVTRRGALLTTTYLFNSSASRSALEIRVWTIGGNITFIPESKR